MLMNTVNPATPPTVEDEMLRLGDLKHIGMALLQFSQSLAPGEFIKKTNAWIYSDNFVGFEIRFKRVKKLNVLVRPCRVPDEIKSVLRAWAGPMGYCRVEVESARQLGAACAYIEASWKRPRYRRRR
jgi:hypothetical protein